MSKRPSQENLECADVIMERNHLLAERGWQPLREDIATALDMAEAAIWDEAIEIAQLEMFPMPRNAPLHATQYNLALSDLIKRYRDVRDAKRERGE